MTKSKQKQKASEYSRNGLRMELSIAPRAYNIHPLRILTSPGKIGAVFPEVNRYLNRIPRQTRTVAMDLKLCDGHRQLYRCKVFGDLERISRELQNAVDTVIRYKV